MNITDLIIALETLRSDYGRNLELYIPRDWPGYSHDMQKGFIMNLKNDKDPYDYKYLEWRDN